MNSLYKQEDEYIKTLCLTTCPKAQIQKFYCEVGTGQDTTSCPIHLQINFGNRRPEIPTMIINRYGDSWVANIGSCTAVLFTGSQTPSKSIFQVMDTREYLILGSETVRKTGYIHFPKITPPKLTQQPKMHIHLKATKMKAS